MGSEGYLINQFIAARTNKRTDEWGGTYTNRTRLPLAIVERIRAAVDPKFIIMFRLSMLVLVEGGSEWPEVVALAQGLEAAGAGIIHTGIGWQEAQPADGMLIASLIRCGHHQHGHRVARGARAHDRHVRTTWRLQVMTPHQA